MAEQPTLTTLKCHIPKTWQAEIQALARQAGHSPEQVIYEAIAQYLGKSSGKSSSKSKGQNNSTPHVLTEVQQRLEIVEHRSHKADEAMIQVLALTVRVAALEQVIQLARLTPRSLDFKPTDEEDPDDEPDEILTSFLESEDLQDRVTQTTRSSANSQNLTTSRTDEDEDMEDEADEILHDFIEP
ncbi:MAG: hypothetical protein HC772_03950 [Leptolyngbyaceae cyanobacterium CRU_2_3]|nr:hypothetical protein [Leptolyngbyaceae cyanobacterium CRU_2_3]